MEFGHALAGAIGGATVAPTTRIFRVRNVMRHLLKTLLYMRSNTLVSLSKKYTLMSPRVVDPCRTATGQPQLTVKWADDAGDPG
jgi:hypothetical protein